ncbi:archaeal proteasome endopeptidase complex subunit alpha [Candidatus Woesearchaeota archaeon]|nr:archaeal proteasome endopeptidase complex subunit alpha [Candidatus Woesearchaeota archaeon]
MQAMPHQLMGYDRAITMFSPEGRLLQVEYAKKTVKQGSTAIGMVCEDGIILVTDKRLVDKMVVPEATEKIFQIDDHIGTTASGILSDARVLIERGQMKAQQHKVTYDSPIDALSIVKEICDLKQICTQSGGLRPFGVSLLVGGVDEDGEARLFETDPTGIYFQYKATAIGEGESEVKDYLYKHYKDNLLIKDGLTLAVKALIKAVGNSFNADRLDVAIIKRENKSYKKLEKKEIEKILTESKKKK